MYVRWTETGAEVKNTFDFTPLDGMVLRWPVRADGVPQKSGEYDLSGIGPREWKFFPLPIDEEGIRGMTGLVTADCAFYADGIRTAYKQKILAEHPAEIPAPVPFAHRVHIRDCDAEVTGEDFRIVIREGLLSRIEKNGKTVLDKPMKLNLWRAPTDNDGIIGFSERLAGEWKDKLIPSMLFGCTSLTAENGEDAVTVTAVGKFLPYAHPWGFDARLVYRIEAGGEAKVSVKLDPYGTGGPEVLPRVGVAFELGEDFERCSWLGRGPGDSYSDRKANAAFGLWQGEARDMNFLYDVPQETGNREDCRRVTVKGDGRGLTVTGKFSFSLHNFALDDLTKARHCDELEKSREKTLYIDHRHRGLGSNSCGPQPEKEYELPMGPFEWEFRIAAE